MATSTRSSSRSQNNYSYPSAYNTATEPASRNTSTTRGRSTSRSPNRNTKTNLNPEKQPSFSTTALNIPIPVPSSPPSLHSNSASSALETRYLARAKWLHRLRLALCLPLLLVGTAILTSQGLALKFYNDTNLPASFSLPLWPDKVNLAPAVMTLVAGGIVVLGCVLYIILALVPSPRPKTSLQSALFAFTTLFSTAAAAAALIFTTYTTYHAPTSPASRPVNAAHTIQSWTCYLSSSASSFNSAMTILQIPAILSSYTPGVVAPVGFERTCHESEAAWGLLVGVVGLSVVGLGLVGVGWWVERGIGRERKRRAGGEKGEGLGFVSRISW